MTNQLAQSENQAETKEMDWNRDQVARMWIEASLRLRTVEKPEIIREVSSAMGKTPNAIKIWYYRHLNPYGFEQYWMDKYTAHYRMRLAPKAYARMNDVVEKEKDLSKLVEVVEHLEGKQQAPTVQINNFVKNEKNTYGI